MSWQTRSETNGLDYFDTLEQALQEAENDPTIWKISKGDTRLVKLENGSWENQPIMQEVLKELERK